jgi:hypothetical protein
MLLAKANNATRCPHDREDLFFRVSFLYLYDEKFTLRKISSRSRAQFEGFAAIAGRGIPREGHYRPAERGAGGAWLPGQPADRAAGDDLISQISPGGAEGI